MGGGLKAHMCNADYVIVYLKYTSTTLKFHFFVGWSACRLCNSILSAVQII